MTKRALSLLLFTLVVVVISTATTTAAAYCRKTTAGGDDCTRTNDALPLYWQRSCIAVRVVVDGDLEREGRMTTARATAIVERATATWRSVQCRGGTVAVEVADATTGRCGADPGARSEIHFAAAHADPGLLGATDVSFDAKTGAIAVARVNVPDVYDDLEATSRGDLDARVEGVVRHELGHFLGLAHSDDASSVMNATYDPSRTDGLTEDDVAGLCDAYDPAQPIGAGCTFSPSVADRGAGLALALAFGVLLRRRRARRAALLVALLFFFDATTADAAKPRKKRTTTTQKAAPTMTAEDAKLLTHDEPTLTSSQPMVAYVVAEDRPPPAAEAPSPSPPVTTPAPTPTTSRSELWLAGRYRASLLPSALVAPIAKTSDDLLFHSAAVELEFRSRSFVIAPSLTFADLTTRDVLVGRRDAARASDFSYVKSDLRAVAASVTLTWSLALSRRTSVELGVELGVATTIGTMRSTWVHETSEGHYEACATVNDGIGCRPQDHEAGSAIRVGDHRESGPPILPWVSLPVVALRMKLADDVAARIGVGASITGVWAGVSLDYGLTR